MPAEHSSDAPTSSIETLPTEVSRTLPTEAEARAEREEPGKVLSLLSLIFGLSAIALALADIIAIVVSSSRAFALPTWMPQALRLAPGVGIILAASGVGLNLIGTWQLLARQHVFDPNETAQDLAIDDVAGLLARIHPGCAVRIATFFGLVAAMVATLLSIWAVPAGASFRVISNNSIHTCSSSGILAPFSIELDNSASAVPVSWSATPVETLPNGTAWAQIIPAKGRLEAGQDQHISVFPNALVCATAIAAGTAPHATGALVVWTTSAVAATYHVRVTTGETSSSQSTLAMSVRQPLTANISPVATASPTPTPNSKPNATATRVPAVPTPCPTLRASIAAPSNGGTYYTSSSRAFSFTSRISGACGTIPASDITWSVTNTQYFPNTTVMGDGKSISYTLQGTLTADPYDITLKVFDPTSGQTARASITIFVSLLIG